MLPWQTPIRDETILTPLPYAPDLYLDGTIHSLPDINLRTLYELPYNGRGQALNCSYATLVASTHLLNRAKSLRTDAAEDQTTFRALAKRSSSKIRCLRIENRAGYTEIMDTAKYIHANLPEDSRLDVNSATPWTNPDVPIIVRLLISTFELAFMCHLLILYSRCALLEFGCTYTNLKAIHTISKPVSMPRKKQRLSSNYGSNNSRSMTRETHDQVSGMPMESRHQETSTG